MNRFIFDNSAKFRIYRHLLFFLATVIVFTLVLFIQNNTKNFSKSLWIVTVNAIFFFGYAYITIFLLIPELLITKKIGWFALIFLLVGIALSALKLLVSDQIFYSSISPENISRKGIFNLRFIIVNTKDMTFIVALFCIVKYIKDYFYAEKMRELVASETKQAQSKLIQSQFDPHFLFNTINNLYAISLLNPIKTIEVISRIKIVLKYINDEIQKEFVSLESEIELIKNYIQLEKLRYGNRLNVNMTVEGEVILNKIPPMILFYLIENSFKHGCSLDAGSPWINIEIKVGTEKINLLVENSKPANPDFAYKTENQLKNLRKRLEIIYKPNGYNLKINDKEKIYQVFIELRII